MARWPREPPRTSVARDARDDRSRGGVRQHFTSSAPFSINDYIAPADEDVPAEDGVRRQRRREGRPSGLPGGALATSCTASIRSSTSSTAVSRTATRPEATPPDLPGPLRHESTAGLPVSARCRGAELCDRRQLLPGGVRRVIPQSSVPRRGSSCRSGTPRSQRVPAGKNSVLDAAGFPNSGYPCTSLIRTSRTSTGLLPRPAANRRPFKASRAATAR
jgi:hypothetical protein